MGLSSFSEDLGQARHFTKQDGKLSSICKAISFGVLVKDLNLGYHYKDLLHVIWYLLKCMPCLQLMPCVHVCFPFLLVGQAQ